MACSSMVERSAVNRMVAGSSPAMPAIKIYTVVKSTESSYESRNEKSLGRTSLRFCIFYLIWLGPKGRVKGHKSLYYK